MNKKLSLLIACSLIILSLAGCTPGRDYFHLEERRASESQTDSDNTGTGDFDKDAPSVSLIMVGDVLMHDALEKCYHQSDGTYNYEAAFEHTKDVISAADLALVNQEVIIAGEELKISGYPAFNADYKLSDNLEDAGFDVICHATNHSMDRGKQGISNCLTNWRRYHPLVTVVGMYETPEDRDNIYIYEKDGMRIAILNYTYDTNNGALPKDMPFAVNVLKDHEEQVSADIQYAEKNADFTIMCVHWGTEYRYEPDAMQAKWSELFLKEGVDLVLGTHPHVIEPIEWLEDTQTGHKMLVYYSLGNFVSWSSTQTAESTKRLVGGMANVILTKDKDGKVAISDYGVRALVTDLKMAENGPSTYFLADYTDEMGRLSSAHKLNPDFGYTYCAEFCDEIWGDLWK